jgi:uncharacterized protein YukE
MSDSFDTASEDLKYHRELWAKIDAIHKQLAEEKSAREAMEYLLSEWQNASNPDYDTLRKQLDIAMEALNNIYTHENNFTKATLIRIAVTALAEINRNK